MRKKVYIAIIALILMLAFSAGVVAQPQSVFTFAGLDTSNEYRDWSSNSALSEICKNAGVNINWLQYNSQEKYSEEILPLLESDAAPDALFKANLSPQDELELLDKGLIIDLSGYITSDIMPNLHAIFQENPEILMQCSLPGGQLATLPNINAPQAYALFWINQDWLRELNMAQPKNTQQLYQVLSAMKTADLNGNMQPDEIPLSVSSIFELKFLLHGFGIIADDWNMCMQDGAPQYAALTDNYREFVEYLALLYSEGLLDGDFLTQGIEGQLAEAGGDQNKYGMFNAMNPHTIVGYAQMENFVALEPLEYNGAKQYRLMTDGITRGTFAVTSSCGDVESVLRFIDTFYALPNARIAWNGIENVTYTENEGGKWTWSAESGREIDELYYTDTLQGGPAHPGWVPAEDFNRQDNFYIEYINTQRSRVNAYGTTALPQLTLSNAATDEVNELHMQLGKLVDTYIARFTIGELELTDENWDAFISDLQQAGVERFVEIWQSAVQGGL